MIAPTLVALTMAIAALGARVPPAADDSAVAASVSWQPGARAVERRRWETATW